jgi:thymidine kinase
MPKIRVACAYSDTRGGEFVGTAKLYFKYASMKAGKSLELLKTADSYERTGKRVAILTPAIDDRHGVGVVRSRLGLEREAHAIEDGCLLTPLIQGAKVVLIDEAQFLSRSMVKRLATEVVDKWGVPVICFGLKNTFKNELFEGSAALLVYADSIEEIKGLCELCTRKATMTLRTVMGKPVYDGNTVQIGDSEYISVCRKHYHNYRGA